MYWSQPTRVDHMHKKWRARKKIKSKKGTKLDGLGVDSWPASDHWSPTGCGFIPGPSSSMPFF
jgi:hypothetical protein